MMATSTNAQRLLSFVLRAQFGMMLKTLCFEAARLLDDLTMAYNCSIDRFLVDPSNPRTPRNKAPENSRIHRNLESEKQRLGLSNLRGFVAPSHNALSPALRPPAVPYQMHTYFNRNRASITNH